MNTRPLDEPLPILSIDAHLSPRLITDLRPYCPSKYLDDFDRFAVESKESMRLQDAKIHGASADEELDTKQINGYLSTHPNMLTSGHYSSEGRLADFDYDGVAAGVIFHGSANLEPIPFVNSLLIQGLGWADQELVGVGHDIYNRWIADFVSLSPHRHVGLVYPTLWDVDAAIAQVEWAHDHGLKGINFAAMRAGDLPEYNKEVWEPFWRVCAERKMPLCTHTGGGVTSDYTGVETLPLMQMETGGWLSRRAIWWMIFGGVFERHPDLKLAIVETPGDWLGSTRAELDAIHGMYVKQPEFNRPFLEKCPKTPSEYIATNVYFGASFASKHEAHQAYHNGLETQFMWGSDYPHVEGTFVYPNGSDMPSVTKLALRNTFCDLPADTARLMVGENLINLFNLDLDALRGVARDIGALTSEELAIPIDAVPVGASDRAFRPGDGGWS